MFSELATSSYGICMDNAGVIQNCCVNGLSIMEECGSICKNNYQTIENCRNRIKITKNKSAGVCYKNNGRIAHCYNTADICAPFAAGICSVNLGTIEQCYNSGEIDSHNAGGGGISYLNSMSGEQAPAFIKNCYNTGACKSTEESGICQRNYSQGTIINCYNASACIEQNAVSSMNLRGKIQNCYYDKTKTKSGGSGEISGTGVTTPDMAKPEFVSKLNADGGQTFLSQSSSQKTYYPELAIFAKSQDPKIQDDSTNSVLL